MQNTALFDQILQLAKLLPQKEKIQLIEQISPEAKQVQAKTPSVKRRSLRGMWRTVNISENDIAAARHEMWGAFPRDDF